MRLPLLDKFHQEEAPLFAKYREELCKQESIEVILKHKIKTAVMYFSKNIEQYDLFKHCIDTGYDFKYGTASSRAYMYKKKIIFISAPLGGPAAAGLIDELGMLGVKNFIACGSAGGFKNQDLTQILLINRAIRDEGTSLHYIKPSVYVETGDKAQLALKEALTKAKKSFVEGAIWTTDAFYRETPGRIAKRIKQGALAVDMECASWAAVAKVRGFQFGQIIYFSDAIFEDGQWSGFRDKAEREKAKLDVFKISVDAALLLDKINQ